MASDPDTLAMTLIYIADQHAKGELTDEEYETAVEHAQGGNEPAQLSLDRPTREPTLVDLLVEQGINAAKPTLARLLKRARRVAAKKFPPRS